MWFKKKRPSPSRYLLPAIIAVAVIDTLIIWQFGPDQSISRKIMEISMRFPIIAFALGVIAGHLFWPLRDP